MYPNQNHLLNPEENGELRRRIKNMDCRTGCKNGTRNIIKALVITNTINFICEILREDPFSDPSRVVACSGLSVFIAFFYWFCGSNTFANEIGCSQSNYSCSNIDNCETCARTAYSYLCPTGRETYLPQ